MGPDEERPLVNTWFRRVQAALLPARLFRLLPSRRPGFARATGYAVTPPGPPRVLVPLVFVPMLLLAGCAFSTIGVGYDP